MDDTRDFGSRPPRLRARRRIANGPVRTYSSACTRAWRTSARVSLSPPSKNPFSGKRPSSSSAPLIVAAASSSFSPPKRSLKKFAMILFVNVSTKKAILARLSAPSAEGGTRWDGYWSARKVATIADSVIISPLKLSDGTRPRGLTARYSFVRGVSRSIISSSNGRPSSLSAMCARCAPACQISVKRGDVHGQRWFVYSLSLSV